MARTKAEVIPLLHAGRKKFNDNPDKPTSKNIPRKPVSMAKILREFRPVLPDALEIVGAAMRGVPVTIRYEIKDISRIGTENFEAWLKDSFSYEKNARVEQIRVKEKEAFKKTVYRDGWFIVYEDIPTKQQVDQAKYVIDTVKTVESKEVEYKQKQLALTLQEKAAGVDSSNDDDDGFEEVVEESDD